jgi:uncharacterized protein YggE
MPMYEAGNFATLGSAAKVSTPIEVGSLEITSRVQVIVEVESNL